MIYPKLYRFCTCHFIMHLPIYPSSLFHSCSGKTSSSIDHLSISMPYAAMWLHHILWCHPSIFYLISLFFWHTMPLVSRLLACESIYCHVFKPGGLSISISSVWFPSWYLAHLLSVSSHNSFPFLLVTPSFFSNFLLIIQVSAP